MDIKILASGSKGNCYRVSDGKTSLLLDAGIPFKRIQAGCGFQTSEIAACLVTHRHGDHAKAAPELIRRGIPVYGPWDMATKTPHMGFMPRMTGMDFGTFTVKAFNVHHDVECYGYLINSRETGEKLLYMTDTSYTEYTFDALTHIMIEANHGADIVVDNAVHGRIPMNVAERVIKTHMSIETLIALLKANDMSRLRQVYLLHLSDSNSDAEEFKRQVQEATGAEVYVF